MVDPSRSIVMASSGGNITKPLDQTKPPLGTRVSTIRFSRYVGVSVAAFLLAQLGLVLAYGVFGWPVLPAVVFSLAVSVGPAYVLNRTLVWPHPGDGSSRSGEIQAFFAVALAGTAISAAVVAAAEYLAGHFTTSHVTLSIAVTVSSIAATALIWLSRYFILDRYVFRKRGNSNDLNHDEGAQ